MANVEHTVQHERHLAGKAAHMSAIKVDFALHNTEHAIKDALHNTEHAIEDALHNTEHVIEEGLHITHSAEKATRRLNQAASSLNKHFGRPSNVGHSKAVDHSEAVDAAVDHSQV